MENNQPTHQWQRNAADFKRRMKQSQIERIAGKYEPKPFQERNATFRVLALLFGYAGQAIIVTASLSYVFAHIYALCADMPYPAAIAAVVSLAFLVIMQLLFRLVISRAFADYYDPYFDTTELIAQVARVAFIVALISTDLFFAYNGSFSAVSSIRQAPAYEAPALASVESIRGQYAPLISTAGAEAAGFKAARTYLKKLSIRDGRTYKTLLDEKNALVAEMRAKITAAESANTAALSAAKTDYEAATAAFQTETINQGHGLALVSVFAFIVAIFSIGYGEFWDFQVFKQMDKSGSHALPRVDIKDFRQYNGRTNGQPQNKIGFTAIALREMMDNPVATDATIHQDETVDIAEDAEKSARFTLMLRDLQAEFANLQNGNGKAETITGRIRGKIADLVELASGGGFSITTRQDEVLRKMFCRWNQLQGVSP